MMKWFRSVPEVAFGRGVYGSLAQVLQRMMKDRDFTRAVFIVDDVFQGRNTLPGGIPVRDNDRVCWVNVDKEPTVEQADRLGRETRDAGADLVVGIGGGSVLDLAKAASILATNPGSAAQYQGWDRVQKSPLFKIGIPTLSGTGAEVSRTCVLTSEVKKQGINDDASRFDMILLDPDLLASADRTQRFYTGMDCYIHSVEALRGTMNNAFGRSLAQTALDLCARVFDDNGSDDDLMVASYLGGSSIVYSEVGICHALSYGLSFVFGVHHGEANCIVFNQLEEFYPKDIPQFRRMLEKQNIELPNSVLGRATCEQIQQMTEIAYLMDRPLTNALGENWRDVLTPEVVERLYRSM